MTGSRYDWFKGGCLDKSLSFLSRFFIILDHNILPPDFAPPSEYVCQIPQSCFLRSTKYPHGPLSSSNASHSMLILTPLPNRIRRATKLKMWPIQWSCHSLATNGSKEHGAEYISSMRFSRRASTVVFEDALSSMKYPSVLSRPAV
jgi:hypothetical protein